MPHTHKGTCQICGCEHAVNNATGVLAKHGYTVAYGFFSGICKGAAEEPLENSRELLDSNVDHWRKEAEMLINWPTVSKVPVHVEGKKDAVLMTKAQYEKTDHFSFERVAKRETAKIHHQGEHLKAHAEAMLKHADKVFLTPLKVVAVVFKNRKIFPEYSDAYEFSKNLKEEGLTARVRRISPYTNHFGVYWTTAAHDGRGEEL